MKRFLLSFFTLLIPVLTFAQEEADRGLVLAEAQGDTPPLQVVQNLSSGTLQALVTPLQHVADHRFALGLVEYLVIQARVQFERLVLGAHRVIQELRARWRGQK